MCGVCSVVFVVCCVLCAVCWLLCVVSYFVCVVCVVLLCAIVVCVVVGSLLSVDCRLFVVRGCVFCCLCGLMCGVGCVWLFCVRCYLLVGCYLPMLCPLLFVNCCWCLVFGVYYVSFAMYGLSFVLDWV